MKYVFNPFTGNFDLIVTADEVLTKAVTYQDGSANDLTTNGTLKKYVGIVVDENGEIVFSN